MAGRNRKHSEMFALNAIKQTRQYQFYLNYLWNLSISRWNWEVPDSVDVPYLEKQLESTGTLCGFREPELDEVLILPYQISGNLNLYRLPTRVKPYSIGYQGPMLEQDDFVILYNNYTRTGDLLAIEIFAARLANLDITADINVQGQKYPVLIESTEELKQTMLNLFMQYSGNYPFIFTDKDMNLAENVKVLNTNSPFVADNLQTLKSNVFTDFLNYMGIPSARAKAERVQASEQAASNGVTYASRMSGLLCRQSFCEKMNERFGTELDVGFQYLEQENIDMYRSDIVEGNIEGGIQNAE